MDFGLTPEQEELQAAAVEFAKRELTRDVRRNDETGRFPHQAWKACAEFGLQGLPVPEEFGGRDADPVTTVAVMEGLGYGGRDNGVIFALNAQLWSVELPLLSFGTREQKQAYLPKLVSGELIGAHGATESESGSDVFGMQTRAAKEDDHYVLNGSKLYITNGPHADLVLVFATLDPKRGMAGICAFLVEKGTPGLVLSGDMDKMGLRTAPMGEVTLTDCEVPAENRLGPEGAGSAIFNSSMAWERSCILAAAIGAMRRQLETCVDYAKARRQFGQSIGKFESISNKIADMYMRMEAARLLVYQSAWLAKERKPAVLEAALAKLFTSEAWIQSSLDAIQLHGAYGYMKEAEIERELRDAVAGTIFSGTSEIQRVIVARMLGL